MSWRSRYLTGVIVTRLRGVSPRDDDATKEKVTFETVRNTYDSYVIHLSRSMSRPNASSCLLFDLSYRMCSVARFANGS